MSKAALEYLTSRILTDVFRLHLANDKIDNLHQQFRANKPHVKIVRRNGVDVFIHKPKRQLSPNVDFGRRYNLVFRLSTALSAHSIKKKCLTGLQTIDPVKHISMHSLKKKCL